MKTILILTLLVGSVIAGFILINKPISFSIPHSLPVSLSQSSNIQLHYYPSSAELKIDNRSYKDPAGSLTIPITAGLHHLTLSAPGYSMWNKDLTLSPQETKELPFIYLFPIHWKTTNIISGNIAQFYLSSDTNKILYLTKGAEHQWCIYQRQTKESKCFYSSVSLPSKLVISPSFKKVVSQTKNNKWQIIFLPPSLVNRPLSLNDSVKGSITNIYFDPQNENILIIRTSQGIFAFDFINDKTESLYSSPSSPLLVTQKNIYFLTTNGILQTINLESDSASPQVVSPFSFIASTLDKIIIKKSPSPNSFFVIDNSHTLYLLTSGKQIPSTVTNNVQGIRLSPSLKHFIIWSNKKISIASYPKLRIQDDNIFSSILPIWFLNDNYLLVNNDSDLNILNLSTKKIWPVTNKVTSHMYYFDAATKYIFYLSPNGIQQISI